MQISTPSPSNFSLKVTHSLLFFSGLITGSIHLLQDDPVLKLNGLGTFVLISLILFSIPVLNHIKSGAPQMLSVYVIATIILYFAVSGMAGMSDEIGLMAKGAEIAILLLLAVRRRILKAQNSFRGYQRVSRF